VAFGPEITIGRRFDLHAAAGIALVSPKRNDRRGLLERLGPLTASDFA
jgi:hypothetical protein